MGLSRLNQLYRQVIMDHNEHPRNFGLTQEGGSFSIEMFNPSCGDEITVELVLNDERTMIQATRFEGVGCSISQASASMMTELFHGISLEEAKHLADLFSQMVLGQVVDLAPLKDAAILETVKNFPARIDCATLAWKAVQNFELDEAVKRKES